MRRCLRHPTFSRLSTCESQNLGDEIRTADGRTDGGRRRHRNRPNRQRRFGLKTLYVTM